MKFTWREVIDETGGVHCPGLGCGSIFPRRAHSNASFDASSFSRPYRLLSMPPISMRSNSAYASSAIPRPHTTIEYRSANGCAARFTELASELVNLKVDVIITRGTPAALAAKRATQPFGEPLDNGVVASLARPGGNVTGLSALVNELAGKRVELMKEVGPHGHAGRFLQQHEQPGHPPAMGGND